MKKFIPNSIKNYLKSLISRPEYSGCGRLSFSQEGEDLILERYFENQDHGLYVDVGAHHPFRFSNTYLFYKKGWRGINIEPMPDSLILFDEHRSEDVNLNLGVSQSEEYLSYFMFNEPALNTFSLEEAKIKNGIHNGEYFIIDEKKVPTLKLSTILDKYLENKKIDFLTIDVEGLDLEVLKSNNWEKYRPKIILVEELRISIFSIRSKSEIYLFLNSRGYELYSRTYNTSFYVRID